MRCRDETYCAAEPLRFASAKTNSAPTPPKRAITTSSEMKTALTSGMRELCTQRKIGCTAMAMHAATKKGATTAAASLRAAATIAAAAKTINACAPFPLSSLAIRAAVLARSSDARRVAGRIAGRERVEGRGVDDVVLAIVEALLEIRAVGEQIFHERAQLRDTRTGHASGNQQATH